MISGVPKHIECFRIFDSRNCQFPSPFWEQIWLNHLPTSRLLPLDDHYSAAIVRASIRLTFTNRNTQKIKEITTSLLQGDKASRNLEAEVHKVSILLAITASIVLTLQRTLRRMSIVSVSPRSNILRELQQTYLILMAASWMRYCICVA